MQGEKRKLPVWRTVGETYRETFRNLLYAIRISWAWFVVMVIAILALGFLTAPLQTENPPTPALILGVAAALGVFVPYSLAMASIAVAWNHKLLLQLTYPGIVYLYLGRDVWRYLGWYILLFLIVVLFFSVAGGIVGFTSALLSAILNDPSRQPPVNESLLLYVGMGILGFVLFLISVLALLRLWVLLPGAALGHRGISFRGVWRRTKGNSWRLLLAAILCWFPPIIVILVVYGLMLAATWPSEATALQPALSPGAVLMATLNQFAGLLVGFFALSLTALCYRFFYKPEDAHQPAEDASL